MRSSPIPFAKPQSGLPRRCVFNAATLVLLLPMLLPNTSVAAEEPPPPPLVMADQSAYAPGATAIINGSGFQPSETLTIQLAHGDGAPASGQNDGPWEVLADAAGAFAASWTVCQEDCVGTTLLLTATGQSSGLSAQTTFAVQAPLPSTYIVTDKSDYAPGSTAYITGVGFQPGEAVTLQVLHADGTPATGADHGPWAVVADASGAFQTTWHVCEDDCLGSTLLLSGVGQASGLTAQTFFTDACPTGGGEVDLTFDPGSAVDDLVYSVAVQPDGKVLIGGLFRIMNQVRRSRIARLNPDGSTDFTFLNGLAGFGGSAPEVYSVVLQPDGKILVGGFFATVNGVTRRGLVRLNSGGSTDTTFMDPGIQTSSSGGTVYSIALQPDGKILVGGTFNTVNGVARGRIARLNSDGSLDTTFQNGMSGANSEVNAVVLQPDGKVLIGGIFITVNGTNRNRIARLNSDGSLDTTFLDAPLTGASGEVSSVALEPDGQVLIGGSFNTVNGTTRNRIARLNADGSLDGAFAATTGNQVLSLALQPDGKILMGGSFNTVNGMTRSCIARLNSDGTLDTTFQNGMSGAAGAVFLSVASVVNQPDGQVLMEDNSPSSTASGVSASPGCMALTAASTLLLKMARPDRPGAIPTLSMPCWSNQMARC